MMKDITPQFHSGEFADQWDAQAAKVPCVSRIQRATCQ
jgi:hypothetical protein